MADDIGIVEQLLAEPFSPTSQLRKVLELSEPTRARLYQLRRDLHEANGYTDKHCRAVAAARGTGRWLTAPRTRCEVGLRQLGGSPRRSLAWLSLSPGANFWGIYKREGSLEELAECPAAGRLSDA